MKANDNTLIARLLNRALTSGRSDDNEETIAKRLKTFHDHNDPIIKAYTSKVKEVMYKADYLETLKYTNRYCYIKYV